MAQRDDHSQACPRPSPSIHRPVIDLHSHVLAGIDDGPETIEGSVALARAAAAAGTRTLVATPHVSARYHNDARTIAQLTAELNARLQAEEIALEVLAGAEIAITAVVEIDPSQLSLLGLGGSRWLLMEPPFTPVAFGLENLLSSLQGEGHRILLAHPERCPAFHGDPAMLSSILASGVLTSITAGSLVGRFGGEVRRFALSLMRDGMVHNVASDAHDHAHRAPGITAELEQAGFGPLADWLTQAVPRAILSDETAIPPRPLVDLPRTAAARRGWWRSFKRAS
jgi:protein-tyrosine phosphatase